jgi:flagellar hook-length control protein FliK
MDTMSTVAATTAATGAATAGAKPEDESAAGAAFALLLQSMAARFKASASPLDANIVRDTAPPQDPQPPEPRDDQRVKADDKPNDAKTAAADRKAAQDDRKDAAADAAANQPANTTAQVDPSQTLQLAALQAQLLGASAPVQAANAAPVIVQTEVVAAAPVATAPIATVDPTAPVAAVIGTVAQQQVAVTPVALAQAAATAQTVNPTALTPQAAAQTTVAQAQTAVTAAAAAKSDTQSQAAAGPSLALTADDSTPQAAAPAQQRVQQSPVAKAQSEALSRLLGADNQIKVAVTVDAPKAAMPSIVSPYNHFVGYTMAANAGEALANGAFGQAQSTNALVAEDGAPVANTQSQPAASAPAIVTAAAAAPLAPAPTASTTTVEAPAPGISGISATQSSSGTQGEFGQTAFGQQGNAGSGATGQASGTAAADAPKQAPAPAQVFEQIKVHITRATKAGLDQVSIQLRPEELGRIEVKLEMAHDGKVKATVIADNAQTLQLMQSDSRGLERALNDAGLRTDANTLEFSLRGDPNTGSANAQTGGTGSGGSTADAEAAALAPETFDYGRAALLRGGVDTYA